MSHTIFITGTDTDVGKTFIAVKILQSLNAAGYSTFALKPIASGASYNDTNELINDDAKRLLKASSTKMPYHKLNPICYEPAIAPHIAAIKANQILSKIQLVNLIQSHCLTHVDVNIIEGVGGWSVPLNDHECFSDVIQQLQIPVILVIALKLGCLNHAILTQQAIQNANIPMIGWIANCCDPSMLALDENIETLQQWMNSSCLGVIPFQPKHHASYYINAKKLMAQLLQNCRIT